MSAPSRKLKYPDNLTKWMKYTPHNYNGLYLDLFNPDMPIGKVYIIQLGDTDIYKIGITTNLQNRLKQIQSKCPIPLKVIHWWEGTNIVSSRGPCTTISKINASKTNGFKLSAEDIARIIMQYPDTDRLDLAYNRN